RELLGELGARAHVELAVDVPEVVLDRLRAEEEGGSRLTRRPSSREELCDLELLRGERVCRGRVPTAGGLPGRLELRARELRPRVGAEAVEDLECRAELLPCPDTLAGAAGSCAVGEVRPSRLVDVGRSLVEPKRLLEPALELVVVAEQAAAARRARERPRLALRARLLLELVRLRRRVFRSAEPEIRLDELRRRRGVDVADPELAQPGRLLLEVPRRLRGTAEGELELAERPHRPCLVETDAERGAQVPRLLRVRPTPCLPSLPGLEPVEPRERGGELGSLTRLAGEPDRLVVLGLGRRPLVPDGMVPGDSVEEAGQHAESGLRPRGLDGRLDHRPS